MESTAHRAIAIVGVGAVLPDAPSVTAFRENINGGRYSISDVSPDRWNPALYYDPDPAAPDKTYSKIGGWVREFEWNPMKWKMAIPPRVANAMDEGQKWAVACTRAALEDYGYPKREFNLDRTAVILGNAMAGEKHYLTALRIYFPEYARELEATASFASLPESLRRDITRELHSRIGQLLPEVTEDTMPGELANCIAGRVANIFNFHGPNFTADAACASAIAAVHAAVEGLIANEFDVAITGGIDRNMGVSSFVKFCKIGALSATGTRPYAEGADGFVMGEGAAIFVMKRLSDAERDGDRIYAVVRGIAGSSDGKGKGITAPNPIGQRLCIQRAWENAGLSPATVSLIEGHGTSTRVGDVVEVQSMLDVLKEFALPAGSIALGSVKSNMGHLKAAAGAAGLLKATLALTDKVLPPSVNCERCNPEIDFDHSPLYVNKELKPWTHVADGARRAAVSAFGFGGTNFHIVLEEHIPHRLTGNGKRSVSLAATPQRATEQEVQFSAKAPLRGALVIGGASTGALADRLRKVIADATTGKAPAPAPPAASDLSAAERISIDYGDAAELADKSGKVLKALAANQPAVWKALRAQGIFRGHGPAPKVAFLYTGQGSQYVNMLQAFRAAEPVISTTFAEADRVLAPLLGKPLSDYIFTDSGDPVAAAKAEDDLRQTAITQPAVLATDIALTRLLASYGIEPDMTMGHSLGEYGALVAAGALPFEDALEAVSARGREMTRVSMADNGRMAAVFAPVTEIQRILKAVDGYVVIANLNSNSQAVIGGATRAVEQATELFLKAGYEAVPLPVSHAFHTSIVAPASEPLRRMLERLSLGVPRIPVVANVSGEFYPSAPGMLPEVLDILARQIASPVQFSKGLQTLFDAGARVFVEVGPKKALYGFVEDVLGDREDVLALFTNHPKLGDLVAFNQALCGLYAAGLGHGNTGISSQAGAEVSMSVSAGLSPAGAPEQRTAAAPETARPLAPGKPNEDRYSVLGHLFADVLEKAWRVYSGETPPPVTQPVAITGAALGLPGTERVFDDSNLGRLLHGEQFIDVLPTRCRRAMLDKNITRLVKSENGGPTFESIGNVADVIKLAARAGNFDLESEFGIPADRLPALDRVTSLAIAAGIDALRDAGIPLVMRYKTTTKGTQLLDRWGLPDALRDDTGVIFASAFPGCDSFADENARYYADRTRRDELAMLEDLRARASASDGDVTLNRELDRRIGELRSAIEQQPYVFDRRFLFRVLSMGHSQLAEYIGARGPNTHLNAACASGAQAVAVAEDWIRAGRCRRVLIVSADDITGDNLIGWFGAGFLATGAAATDEVVEDAALPFDRRRHGMIIGMGAAAIVVESAEAARERGIAPICEVISAVTANSAFHGTRLDVNHIAGVMEDLIAKAESRTGIRREVVASQTVFVSHETYTPARGGSASAEIHALRRVFGDAAGQIVITNTKGFTGHAMATAIEDVVAIKALETGCVPPVPNFKEVDPELGVLNLSKGGTYPIEYALRLGAGFGSQISMTLMRRVAAHVSVRPTPNALGYATRIVDDTGWKSWLTNISGDPAPELEVVQHTLRVRDRRVSVQPPAEIVARPVIQEVRPAAAPAPEPARETVAPPQVVAVGTVRDPVENRILELVSEKTGYPADMLDLDLDLEADLGVDTVKQAEVFSSVREAYAIPRDEKLRLRDFPTLAHVIRFVHERRPDLAGGAPPAAELKEQLVPAAAPPPAVAPLASDPVKERIVALVVEKTGYPADMLDLELDLEADLGVDTVKQAEMFAAIREVYGIPRDPNLKLRDFPTLAHVIRFVYDRRPDLAVAAAPVPVVQDSAGSPEVPQTPLEDRITAVVLDIVSEKTGYPKDMLDLDLDLEADLGIDTVKQAEMFASVRSAFNIPRDADLKLRDFPTLAHVIRFARERSPEVTAPVVAAEAPAPPLPREPVNEDDLIRDKVLEIVAEKTGYPKDMLDLDLDLEADLGIDTVKQAEMFASVRSAFNIPRDADLKLRDFPTLAHVIRFARERSAKPETAAAPSAPPVIAPQPARPAAMSLDAAESIPRRVPLPCLRPALKLCKQSGVTLGPEARVVLVPDHGGVANALSGSLQQRGVQVLELDAAADGSALAARLKEWLAAGPVQGVYWLPALDFEGDLAEMDLAAWREAVRVRVKSLYATMRTLFEEIAHPATFLVSATRLGGQHGYDQTGAVAPLGGAVTGFIKTYKRERPEAHVKAVDFAPSDKPAEIADLLIAETLRDPGCVEIGYKGGLRWTVALHEEPAADGMPGLALNNKTVFVVTGAAGSIVSAITADLAAASGGSFYLLDLTPAPDPSNPDLARLETDREGLKRELAARLQARGERATPALIEKELSALERGLAAHRAIEAVRASGGTAEYFSVDLTDAAAVAAVVDRVRQREGRIDVLLHAAGMDRSRLLVDKEPREFDLVFDVKADGWFNVLHAIGRMPLAATVAFSSIAGRFGNGGQTDYSSANDLLCKIASSFRSTRPGTRAIAIDWTAWAGIGMAARGSIPKMMEAAGIETLPPEAGIPVIRRELTQGGTRGEVVIAGSLGALLNEWDTDGGADPNALNVPGEQSPARGPMIGRITSFRLHGGPTIDTVLDPKTQPFLHDHRIDGTPVLPGVMGIEAFGEAALCLVPGWHVRAVENVNFLAPFKFYRDEPRSLTIGALLYAHGAAIAADCRLVGSRVLANQAEAQTTTHFTGRVLLGREPRTTTIGPVPHIPDSEAVEAPDIYRVYFHGPAYRVLRRAWRDDHKMIGQLETKLGNHHQPPELPTVMAPRLLELCFQTVGLWEIEVQHRMGLPLHADSVTVFGVPDPSAEPVYAVVTAHPPSGSFDAEVLDAAGRRYVQLLGYRTVALSTIEDPGLLKTLHAVMA